MQIRHIMLGALTILVSTASIALFLGALDEPETAISDEAVQAARQRHQRAVTRAPDQPAPRRLNADPDPATSEPETPEPARKTLPVPGVGAASIVRRDTDEQDQMQRRTAQINRLFDQRDYEKAFAQALVFLSEKPGNISMRRIAVSAACAMGDQATAQVHFVHLPPLHRRQMKRRCTRHDVALDDPQ